MILVIKNKGGELHCTAVVTSKERLLCPSNAKPTRGHSITKSVWSTSESYTHRQIERDRQRERHTDIQRLVLIFIFCFTYLYIIMIHQNRHTPSESIRYKAKSVNLSFV